MITKGLSRGEILIGLEQGFFKEGDEFSNGFGGVIFIDDTLTLRWKNDSEYVLCAVSQGRYDLIEKSQFKVGDWVYYTDYDMKTYIVKLLNYHICPRKNDFEYQLENFGWRYESFIRKATDGEIAVEKQRRFWSKLGREVNGYRLGDICRWKDLLLEVEYVDQDNVWLKVFNHDEPESCGVCLHKEELSLFIPVETPRFEMKG